MTTTRRSRALWVVPFVLGCAMETGGPNEPAIDKAEAAQRTFEGKADWGFDICASNGWYDDASCEWFCPRPDPACEVPPLGPEPHGAPVRYPIVLAHGFMAGPGLIEFYRVPDALAADGHRVVEGRVPPFDSVAARAEALAVQIDETLASTGAAKVNLVAHSMGGLDARYVVSSLGYGDRVASVTTISSPHRGSAAADAALVLTEHSEELINDLAHLIGVHLTDLAESPRVRDALVDLSESRAVAFNAENPDDPRVFYQSWAGVSNVFGVPNPRDDIACAGSWLRNPGTLDLMDGLLVKTAGFTAHGHLLVPNDGMVTVDSARWGEFRGCIPADHADEVGQLRDPGKDRFTGFDHIRFFRNIAFDLAARGL